MNQFAMALIGSGLALAVGSIFWKLKPWQAQFWLVIYNDKSLLLLYTGGVLTWVGLIVSWT